jgi:hypothetical protein
VLCLTSAVVLGARLPAYAQSPSPAAAGPKIDGEVSGGLEAGSTLTVRADVTMPGGWQGLHLVDVAILSDGREIERLTYEVESTRLDIGERDVLIGTGAEGTGTYLRVTGPRVIVTTGGPYLSIEIDADVVRSLPEGPRFRLSAETDAGDATRVTRTLGDGSDEGFGWDVVLAAALAALLVGAAAGNLVASRRRMPPKLSVYGVVQRRLDDEARGAKPAT